MVAFLKELTGADMIKLDFENTELLELAEAEGKAVRVDVLVTVRTHTGNKVISIDLTSIELSKVRKRLDIAPRDMTRLERCLVFLAADLDTALDPLRDQQSILIDALLIVQKERP